MKNYFQITIDGKLHAINLKNIALLEQINEYITEIHLFTKDKNNEQIKFKVAYNYVSFINALDNKNKFSIDHILNEFKD